MPVVLLARRRRPEHGRTSPQGNGTPFARLLLLVELSDAEALFRPTTSAKRAPASFTTS